MAFKGTFEVSLDAYLRQIKLPYTSFVCRMRLTLKFLNVRFQIISTDDTFRIRFLYDSKSALYGILMNCLKRIKFI